ncbi:hypothetical protein BTW15_10275 [Pseudomonas syringae pv. tomato]|uniref:Uncharacterized protein n=4 Tax=Pseudomonas syringae group TaxID=136849 RepID=A0A0N8T0T8_PSESX|nr:hypothetical protein XJ28_06615 [Pseudomonas syringae pv. tomato]KPB76755.1 Unknown protein sequence [Pseudomonas syringae pv. maculicola]KPC07126.1 Unknown protein sequence [Pseudomonas amygdali pv. lachrymans]KPW30848.1 hypothetical protein ALO87_101907 [Pseudomonas syringae pv. apii]KPY78112.1 Unknown protein sequence [Pseudomonas syringae pv. spinaceae]RMM05316.1 hypothetical protein ALQ85_101927 [Pseudomonas syringae]RMU12178.1 hypothetical protein ALP36_102127 [Pseudomonas syringae p
MLERRDLTGFVIAVKGLMDVSVQDRLLRSPRLSIDASTALWLGHLIEVTYGVDCETIFP